MSHRSRVPGLIDPDAVKALGSEIAADAPLAWYRLDDTSGNAADSSGNSRTATKNGTVTQQSTALSSTTGLLTSDFDGSTGYFQVADAAWMDVAQWSVVAIINPDVNTGSNYNCIMSRDRTSPNRAFSFYANGGVLALFSNLAVVTGATAISAGTTYHVACTFDGAYVRLYVNGVLDANTPAARALNTSITAPLEVGASGAGTASPAFFFNGRMSDVAFYGKELTPERILVHAKAAGLG